MASHSKRRWIWLWWRPVSRYSTCTFDYWENEGQCQSFWVAWAPQQALGWKPNWTSYWPTQTWKDSMFSGNLSLGTLLLQSVSLILNRRRGEEDDFFKQLQYWSQLAAFQIAALDLEIQGFLAQCDGEHAPVAVDVAKCLGIPGGAGGSRKLTWLLHPSFFFVGLSL